MKNWILTLITFVTLTIGVKAQTTDTLWLCHHVHEIVLPIIPTPYPVGCNSFGVQYTFGTTNPNVHYATIPSDWHDSIYDQPHDTTYTNVVTGSDTSFFTDGAIVYMVRKVLPYTWGGATNGLPNACPNTNDTLASYVIKYRKPNKICLVTVDTLEHNKILFDNATLTLGDTIILLKQSIGGLAELTRIPVSQTELTYTDTASDARVQEYDYYTLSTKSNCDTSHARSLHLLYNNGQLQWKEYISNDTILGFYITKLTQTGRDTIGTVPRIGTDPNYTYTYTDLNFNAGNQYQIVAEKVGGCNTSGIHKIDANISGEILSNKLQVTTGVEELNSNQLMYLMTAPKGMIYGYSRENITINIYSLDGRILQSQNVNGNFSFVDLTPSLYILNVAGKSGSIKYFVY